MNKTDIIQQELKEIAISYNEKAKQQIVADYNNGYFIDKCKYLRETSDLEVNKKKSSFRQLYEFPSVETYKWLQSIFLPLYGKNWQKHPKVWNHPMVAIWRVSK